MLADPVRRTVAPALPAGPEPLAARQGIADLVHRYALAVRRRDVSRFEPLFTADATFEVRTLDFADPAALPEIRAQRAGRADVIAHIARSANDFSCVCPIISNLLIQIEGATAVANCLMSSWIWPGHGRMIGEYDDTFRYEDDGWRFSARIYTILGQTGNGSG